MKELFNRFKDWCHKNGKKILKIGGIVIVVGVGVFILHRDWQKILNMINNVMQKVAQIFSKDKSKRNDTAQTSTNKSVVSRTCKQRKATFDSKNNPTISPDTIVDVSSATLEPIALDNIFAECKEVQVNMFLRNLPQSWHPSYEKRMEAERYGIKLGENQTLVDPHNRLYRIPLPISTMS